MKPDQHLISVPLPCIVEGDTVLICLPNGKAFARMKAADVLAQWEWSSFTHRRSWGKWIAEQGIRIRLQNQMRFGRDPWMQSIDSLINSFNKRHIRSKPSSRQRSPDPTDWYEASKIIRQKAEVKCDSYIRRRVDNWLGWAVTVASNHNHKAQWREEEASKLEANQADA